MDEKEVQIARLMARDYEYFAKNCLQIKTKEHGIQPFVFNRAQSYLWSVVKKIEGEGKPVRIIILKARQLGMSTWVEGYLMWKAITQPATNGLVVSHLKEHASRLFRKVELMYERLPKPLYEEMESQRDSRKKGLHLAWSGDQETSIHVDTAGNKNIGRGDTINWVHLSEIAFYDDAEDIIFGLNNAVPKGAMSAVFLESTGNGIGNYFNRSWQRAKQGIGYVPIFIPWSWDPDNRMEWDDSMPPPTKEEKKLMKDHDLTREQIAWRRWSIENDCDGDEELFRQENPLTEAEAFIIKGKAFFDRAKVKDMYNAAIKNKPVREGTLEFDDAKPEFEEFEAGPWRIYEKPVPGAAYAVGADVASGTSRDYSAAHIINCNTGKIAATFREQLDEDQFALQLKFMGLAYNRALIACERNNSGRATILALQRMGYERLFYHMLEDEWSGGLQQVWGWSTNTKTRPVMLSELKAAIRKNDLVVPDDRTCAELGSFRGGDKPMAVKGTNDDMVMSLAIANSEEVRNMALAFSEEHQSENHKPSVSTITGY